MNVKVNQEKCIGCSTCVAVESEVFKMNAEGKAEVIAEAKLEEYKDSIDQAKSSCPVDAIEIE